MKTLTIIITKITITPQVRVETADLLMVKPATGILEVSHNETEAKDLSIVNISFRIINIREAHSNKTVLNMVVTVNAIFREIEQTAIDAKAMAMVLRILEDAFMVGLIIRIAMEQTSISITCMIHNQNNMALPAVYAVALIILLSIVTRENII